MNRIPRSTKMLLSAVVFLVGVLCLVMALAASKSHHGQPAVTSVKQPPSAASVAYSVGCRTFHDTGASQETGLAPKTLDSGTCWIGEKKYAINTFASTSVRNAWLKGAEQLGVMPKWETANAVVYPSISS